MKHPVSWMSLLRTARAPLTVVALAAIALVVPPQSSDMLAALTDGAGFWAGSFWFYVALGLLTFSGWYWTRALIEARFDGQSEDERIDAYAYAAVPWLVFVLTFLLGVGLILRSAAWRLGRNHSSSASQITSGMPAHHAALRRIRPTPSRKVSTNTSHGTAA